MQGIKTVKLLAEIDYEGTGINKSSGFCNPILHESTKARRREKKYKETISRFRAFATAAEPK